MGCIVCIGMPGCCIMGRPGAGMFHIGAPGICICMLGIAYIGNPPTGGEHPAGPQDPPERPGITLSQAGAHANTYHPHRGFLAAYGMSFRWKHPCFQSEAGQNEVVPSHTGGSRAGASSKAARLIATGFTK